jgi:hypothetical protein
MLAEEGSGVLQLLAAETEFTCRCKILAIQSEACLYEMQKTLIYCTLQIDLLSDQSDFIAPSPMQKPISYLEKEVRRRRLGKIITLATPIPTSQTSLHSLL